MARFLFVWTIMIGAMVGVREAQHFEVDVWPNLSRRSEAAVRIVARLGILALALVFVWAGIEFTRFAWNRTSELADLPLWLIHVAWPVAGFTWMVFAGEQIVDEARVLLGIEAMSGNVLSAGQAALVLFGVFVGLLVLRVPVAFALGLACLPILLIEPRLSMMMLAQETFNAYNSFILLAVPFFLLTANLMSIGGITDRLVALVALDGRALAGIAGADQCRAVGVLRRHLRLLDGGRGEPVEDLHRCPDQGGLRPFVLHRHHGGVGGAGGHHPAVDPDDRVGRADLDIDRRDVPGGHRAGIADRRRADG